MDYSRLQELAGIDPKQEQLHELATLKRQLNAQLDEAIKLAEQGQPLNEGIISSLKAAVKGTVKAGADLVSQAASKFKEVYADSRARDQLNKMHTELKTTVRDSLLALQKASPHLMKRDEEVKTMFADFQKQLDTLVSGLETREHFLEKSGSPTTAKTSSTKPDVGDVKDVAPTKDAAKIEVEPDSKTATVAKIDYGHAGLEHTLVAPGSKAEEALKKAGYKEAGKVGSHVAYMVPEK